MNPNEWADQAARIAERAQELAASLHSMAEAAGAPAASAMLCRLAASSWARSAIRAACSANSFGFITLSPVSGSLGGQEKRVDHGSAAGQRHTFNDIVRLGQLRRLRLLVPEGGQ